jgi:rubrerythrin
MSLARDMAFSDFDDAEEKGNKEVAAVFKRTARDWQSWVSEVSKKRWKVKAGDYTLSLTSPRGVMIDVIWDYNPMSQKVDITVEGPKGKSRKFVGQAMAKLGKGERAAVEYLWWLADTLHESRNEVLNAVLEMEEGIGMTIESLSEEIGGILSEKRMGREAGGARKGPGGAGAEVKYGAHPMEKSGSPGQRKAQKNTYNRSIRRQKRKEIERQMKGEGAGDNWLAYLDALVQEGITEIPLAEASDELTERTQMNRGMEKALNNLVSVAQSHRGRGDWIEKWANDSLATGRMDVAVLLDMAGKNVIARETKAVAAAIGRVVSMAAAMVSEADEMLDEPLEEATTKHRIGDYMLGYEAAFQNNDPTASDSDDFYAGWNAARDDRMHGKKHSSKHAKKRATKYVSEAEGHHVSTVCPKCAAKAAGDVCPDCGAKLGLVGEPGNPMAEDSELHYKYAAKLIEDGASGKLERMIQKRMSAVTNAFIGAKKRNDRMQQIGVGDTEAATFLKPVVAEMRKLAKFVVGAADHAAQKTGIREDLEEDLDTPAPPRPRESHGAGATPHSTLADELQMILRGETVSQG